MENGLLSQRRAPFEEGGKPNSEQAERATVSRALEGRVCTAEQSDTVSHVLRLSTDDGMIPDGSGEIGCNRTSVS